MTVIVGQIVDAPSGAALPNATVTTPLGLAFCDLSGAFEYDSAILGTPLTGHCSIPQARVAPGRLQAPCARTWSTTFRSKGV